jgi:hypothetical protein
MIGPFGVDPESLIQNELDRIRKIYVTIVTKQDKERRPPVGGSGSFFDRAVFGWPRRGLEKTGNCRLAQSRPRPVDRPASAGGVPGSAVPGDAAKLGSLKNRLRVRSAVPAQHPKQIPQAPNGASAFRDSGTRFPFVYFGESNQKSSGRYQ